MTANFSALVKKLCNIMLELSQITINDTNIYCMQPRVLDLTLIFKLCCCGLNTPSKLINMQV